MMRLTWVAVLAVLFVASTGFSREWKDASGKYVIQAELIARNEDSVVLERANQDLVIVEVKQLSDEDQEYLASKEGEAHIRNVEGAPQVWHMRSGLRVTGTVVEYCERDVTIQRKRTKVYVNDRVYDNLPGVYRRMVPKIVEHFENVDLPDAMAFKTWVRRQRGEPRTFTCQGVMMELANGDVYGIPFFFFDAQDLEALRPGWESWIAAKEAGESQKEQELALRAQAIAQQRDREADREIARLQLGLSAVNVGLTNLWEVQMGPGPGNMGWPVTVVVMGRTSDEAAANAMAKQPGSPVLGIRRVRRRF